MVTILYMSTYRRGDQRPPGLMSSPRGERNVRADKSTLTNAARGLPDSDSHRASVARRRDHPRCVARPVASGEHGAGLLTRSSGAGPLDPQAMHNACWTAHLAPSCSIVSSIDRPLIEGAREHGLKPYRRRLRVGLTRIRDASKVWG